ncbi:flippase-like domain-containing protein [Saliphagus sp. LR7]|uniref:lysylphosphatidylglycerol synthase transmembrane domain-containing protein n=1 Tax=Saliphagus sp. LR7 TaxID=2282654 RepID=UPI001300B5DD|nr:flippase-like domain-containing protein [Saliphagus sp. LR7]
MTSPDLGLATVVGGFVAAVALLSVVLAVVGLEPTVSVLAGADRLGLAALCCAVALWAVAWSYTLSIVLSVLGVAHGPVEAGLLFGNLVFANSVAPSTYLGGEPFAAFLFSRRTGTGYETGFAAVTSTDLLNYAPMVPLAGVGLLYVTTTAVVGGRTELALAAVFSALLALIAVVVAGWRRRDRAAVALATTIGGLSTRMSGVVPGVRPVRPAPLEARIRTFVREVESVADDRSSLALGLGYSALGWLSLSAALWFALYAVGHATSPAVALFAVPIAAVSNVLPVPGGIGGVESILIVLLVAAAGVPAPTAAAATLLYRGGTYWLPLVVGGGTVVLAQGPRRGPI